MNIRWRFLSIFSKQQSKCFIMRKLLKYIIGFLIIAFFCAISLFITNYSGLKFPSSIFGLLLFTFALWSGLVKIHWVEDACNFLIKNMALCIVPFVGGIVVYQKLVFDNLLVITLVVFVATTISIVSIGLFTEYGLKLLRLYKMRRKK